MRKSDDPIQSMKDGGINQIETITNAPAFPQT